MRINVLYTPERARRVINDVNEFQLFYVLVMNSKAWSYVNQRVQIDGERQEIEDHIERPGARQF